MLSNCLWIPILRSLSTTMRYYAATMVLLCWWCERFSLLIFSCFLLYFSSPSLPHSILNLYFLFFQLLQCSSFSLSNTSSSILLPSCFSSSFDHELLFLLLLNCSAFLPSFLLVLLQCLRYPATILLLLCNYAEAVLLIRLHCKGLAYRHYNIDINNMDKIRNTMDKKVS